MAYLDHAATSPLRPEAMTAMLPLLTDNFGNPSGSHAVARAARDALEDARQTVAAVLGREAGEVVFTSGGTEADNLAVLGVAGAGAGASAHGNRTDLQEGPPPGRGALVCSAVEHPAVLEPGRRLGARVVGVGPDGVLDLDDLASALGPHVRLVSVMTANNEVGVIQPLDAVAGLVHELAPGAVLHSDAVHAAAALDLAPVAELVDMLSLSAHKFGGPKGIGALVIRAGTPFSPPLGGGSQEWGRRPGTPHVAGAVGMAAALEAAHRQRVEECTRVGALRDRLAAAVLAAVPGAVDTVGRSAGSGAGRDGPPKMPGSFHLLVPGVDNEELLVLLDDLGVCASAGSACASGALEPSHVLLAMGLSARDARSAVRFSLGYSTTGDEVDAAAADVTKAVEQLRR